MPQTPGFVLRDLRNEAIGISALCASCYANGSRDFLDEFRHEAERESRESRVGMDPDVEWTLGMVAELRYWECMNCHTFFRSREAEPWPLLSSSRTSGCTCAQCIDAETYDWRSDLT